MMSTQHNTTHQRCPLRAPCVPRSFDGRLAVHARALLGLERAELLRKPIGPLAHAIARGDPARRDRLDAAVALLRGHHVDDVRRELVHALRLGRHRRAAGGLRAVVAVAVAAENVEGVCPEIAARDALAALRRGHAHEVEPERGEVLGRLLLDLALLLVHLLLELLHVVVVVLDGRLQRGEEGRGPLGAVAGRRKVGIVLELLVEFVVLEVEVLLERGGELELLLAVGHRGSVKRLGAARGHPLEMMKIVFVFSVSALVLSAKPA